MSSSLFPLVGCGGGQKLALENHEMNENNIRYHGQGCLFSSRGPFNNVVKGKPHEIDS
jgi:hypothetical protein